jgi:hypothetical protein
MICTVDADGVKLSFNGREMTLDPSVIPAAAPAKKEAA